MSLTVLRYWQLGCRWEIKKYLYIRQYRFKSGIVFFVIDRAEESPMYKQLE